MLGHPLVFDLLLELDFGKYWELGVRRTEGLGRFVSISPKLLVSNLKWSGVWPNKKRY